MVQSDVSVFVRSAKKVWRIQVAKKMLSSRIEIDTIAKCTDLAVSEVQKIREEQKNNQRYG